MVSLELAARRWHGTAALTCLTLFAFVALVSCKNGPAPGPTASVEHPGAPVTASAQPVGSVEGATPAFAALLERLCLSFEPTEGYVPEKVHDNALWRYEHAVRSSRLPVEIRYGAAPPKVDERVRELCKGGTCPVAPPKLVVRSILADAFSPIAKGDPTERLKEFPLYAVRPEFNAQWGGVASFEVDPKFAAKKQAVAVFIHRQGCGSAMFVGLYDEYSQQIEDEWMRAFHSLKFGRPMGDAKSRELAASLAGSIWQCGEEGFVQMRFAETTWTILHVSVAMAAMGVRRPYETAVHDLGYQPNSRFSARVFRVDNMEQGDRTPANPKAEQYHYSRQADQLTVNREPSGPSWTCSLVK